MERYEEAYEETKEQAQREGFACPELYIVLREYANLPVYLRKYCEAMERAK